MPDNPWLGRGVFHWAHQGGAREGPSNTLLAMRRALENGAHGLELDVHRTKDGHLVLSHDKTLDRTTDGSGLIAEHTLSELRALDAAYWWVPGTVVDHDAAPDRYILRARAATDAELRIPTLAEVLERYSVPMTLEIKDEAAVAPVVKLLCERKAPIDSLIVTSFMERAVKELARLAPELHLGPGRVWTPLFLIRTRLRLPPRSSPYAAIQVPHRYELTANLPKWLHRIVRVLPRRWRAITVIDKRFIAAAHRANMAVHAWTIDDADEMRELIDVGVDGIMTDRPSVLAGVLG